MLESHLLHAPLAGLKVIELGIMITAPLAGMMLGDLGADVVKIERPDGDPFRSFRGGKYSPHFVAFNRNKKSVVLDLRIPPHRAKLLQLLEDADALIENFRPGVFDRLVMPQSELRDRYPRLIHCSITGFGENGPYKDRAAFDTIGQALSGIAGLAIDPVAPSMVGTTISDNVTGMYACYAILGAILERQKTGRGARVEVNMLEASIAFMPDAFMNFEMLGMHCDPLTRVSISQAFALRCRDGKLLGIHLSSPEVFWTNLLSAIDRPDVGDDLRFSTRAARIENYSALALLLSAVFAERDRVDWMTRFDKHDVPFAPIHAIADVMQDPQVEALQVFRELSLPDGRSVAAVQAPVRFDGVRPHSWSAPPVLGAQTAEILEGLAATRDAVDEVPARDEGTAGRFRWQNN